MFFPTPTIVSPSSSSSSSSHDALKPLASAITLLISMAFLNFALKCIEHLAWPLLALGYPMCASIQAIEADSNREMRDLISYWILLSLLYLFEYAFMWLLQWFQFWPYMKLMIIFWLVIPNFRQSSYVYNNLIRSYISMKPQTAICRLNNWRRIFIKKVNFLLQAEKYIRENGTEALEKLIASKAEKYIKENGTEALEKLIARKDITDKPDAEATNAIRATCNKEMQQTSGKMLQTAHNEIKDLEIIEKKEIPAGKQDIPYISNLAPSQNASSTMVETKGIALKNRAGEEFPHSSTHKEVQKDWSCALCQETASSKEDFNSHLHGKKDRAAYEALKAKIQPCPQKLRTNLPKEAWKPKNISNQLSYKTKIGEMIVNIGFKGDEAMDHKKDTTDKPDAEAVIAVRATCNKEIPQTNGKMLQAEHKDIKDLEVIEKKEIPACKQDVPSIRNLAPIQNASSTMVETKGIAGKDRAGEEFPQSSTHKEVQKEWTCALCLVTVLSEMDLNYHLDGKKHKAVDEALKAKTQPVLEKRKIYSRKEEWKQKTISNHPTDPSYKTKNGESIVNIGLKGNVVMAHKVRELHKNLYEPVRMNYSKLRCEACNVCCSSEVDLRCHLNGRKHLAKLLV